jgi:multimeric flavodoxin WrbA
MKAIAVNGSPRRSGNTAALLGHALDGAKAQGAETEFVHLADLTFRGCSSCFSCKRKGGAGAGSCAMRDDLSPVLKRVMEADALFLGSPVYLSDVTGAMRSFLERLAFMNISYGNPQYWYGTKPINGAFFYTMNVTQAQSELYAYAFAVNTGILRMFGGRVEQLLSTETYQFDDYAKYDAGNFDEAQRRLRRDTAFPEDCRRAFDIGKAMVVR